MNGKFQPLGMSYSSVLIIIRAAYVECTSELIFHFPSDRIVKEALQTHG